MKLPSLWFRALPVGSKNTSATWIVPAIIVLAPPWPNTLIAQDSGMAFQPVKTELVRGGDKAQTVSVDVTGVQDLYLVVTIGPDNYRSDQAIWAEPKLIDKSGRDVDLTTLKPKRAQVGWGRLYINENQHGRPLKIAQEVYGKGFWAHGPSLLHFRLDGKYTRFESRTGIDTGAGTNGSVQFEVTNVAPIMPDKSTYAGQQVATVMKALPAAESSHQLNPKAADILLRQGVKKLVFVRRFTLSANHVYTEYVNSRWTPGGGLAVLDLKTGVATDLVPELTEGVVNRFDVSFDAERIVFDYKKSAGEGYRIYEVGVDGTGLRQLTFAVDDEAELVRRYAAQGYHHGTDDMHPCYLPDGGIVFTSTRCRTSVLCNGADVYTTKVLYRMDADGKNIRRLSSNAVSEASPAVLPDGRIIYHRWEYNDKGAGAVKCLWAMRPDGTASSEVYGNMITDPETMIYPRPIPGSDNKVVFLGTTHCCPNNAMGTVIVLDMHKDMRSREAMTFVTKDVDARTHNGFHFLVDGKWVHDKTGKPGRLFKDPYPLSEQLFIVAHKPKGFAWSNPTEYDLYLLDKQGRETLLYRDEGISCWHPFPLRPRSIPPVPVTPTRKDLAAENLAHCVVTDIYAGLDGVERGAVKYIRILEQTPRPWTARNSWSGDKQNMAHTSVGYGILGMKAQHGVVPVEDDGSANFYVPAGRNIYFQALDEAYMAIQTERTYVNYLPGETRSCIGCHERAGRSPHAQIGPVTTALRREPSMPAAQPGDDSAQKLFDYERQIQPIWDSHCVRCHNDEKDAKASLDLTGRPTALYCRSYENLMGEEADRSKRSRYPLVGAQVNENGVRAYVEYTPPYSFGAHTSILAAVFGDFEPRSGISDSDVNGQLSDRVKKLREQHKAVEMSKEEFIKIVNWLDASCQYYGSYWGKKHSNFSDSPYFRPDIPFEEAIGDRWPLALRPLYEQ